MNHSDIKSLTANYLDGELPLADRAQFDGHLDQCDDCSQELAAMRATIKLLRTLPNPEPPTDLVDNVMARIRDGEGQLAWPERIAEFFSDLTIPRYAMPAVAMAAGLTIVLLGGNIQLPARGGNPNPAPAVQVAMTPGTPVAARNANNTGSATGNATGSATASARVPQRVLRSDARGYVPLQGGNPQMGGSFVFRGENQNLGPIVRESRNGGFFAARPSRSGALLGASAVGETPVHLVATHSGATGSSVPSLGAFVKSQPGMAGELSGSISSGGDLERDERRLRELDVRLAFLLRNPTRFAHQLGSLSLAEQELWLKQLAARSVDRGDSAFAVRALRNSGVVTADFLAETFAAAAAQQIGLRGSSVASQSEAR